VSSRSRSSGSSSRCLLLQITDATPSPAARFFSITAQLPLELQMLLCYRLVGSPKEIIPGKQSEVAFKSLARGPW